MQWTITSTAHSDFSCSDQRLPPRQRREPSAMSSSTITRSVLLRLLIAGAIIPRARSYVAGGSGGDVIGAGGILSKFADVRCELVMTVGRTPSTAMREYPYQIMSSLSPLVCQNDNSNFLFVCLLHNIVIVCSARVGGVRREAGAAADAPILDRRRDDDDETTTTARDDKSSRIDSLREALLGEEGERSMPMAPSFAVRPLNEPSSVGVKGRETVRVAPSRFSCRWNPGLEQYAFGFFLDFASRSARMHLEITMRLQHLLTFQVSPLAIMHFDDSTGYRRRGPYIGELDIVKGAFICCHIEMISIARQVSPLSLTICCMS